MNSNLSIKIINIQVDTFCNSIAKKFSINKQDLIDLWNQHDNSVAMTFMTSDAAPALEKTGVTEGTYNYATITVDPTGRIINSAVQYQYATITFIILLLYYYYIIYNLSTMFTSS